MERNKPSRASLAAFLFLLLVCTGLFLWMCSKYLLPVIMGEVLALASLGAHSALSKKIWPKLSAFLTTVGLFVLVIAPISVLVTLAAREATSVARSFQEEGATVERVTEAVGKLGERAGNPEEVKKQTRAALTNGAKTASMAVFAVAKALPGAALSLALALLACYFFLLDGGRLPRRLVGLLPVDQDLRDELVDAIRSTSTATLRAGMAAATAQSLVILGAFLVLGIPSAFLAAGLTFIAAWVPMLGTFPAVLGGGAYLLWEGDYARLAGLAAFGLVAGLSDNVARPLVLRGGGDRLHPLLSLIAIFGGIELFGIMGVFVGPILAAVVVSLYDVWPTIARRYGMDVKDAL